MDQPEKVTANGRKTRLFRCLEISDCKAFVFTCLEIFAAELVGTGLLVFFGCASCVAGDGIITDFHPYVSFGLIVSSVIAVFGHISGSHLNPAVTVAFFILGHISIPLIPIYFLAEVLGAVLGYGLLVLLSPNGWIHADTCVTQPHEKLSWYQAAGIEFVATSALIFLVCGVTDPRCADKQDSVPLKFGALIIVLCIAVGRYTGTSLNPARSLGPAVWTGTWNQHWVYWIFPLAAGIIIPLFYKLCFLSRQRSKNPPVQEVENIHTQSKNIDAHNRIGTN